MVQEQRETEEKLAAAVKREAEKDKRIKELEEKEAAGKERMDRLERTQREMEAHMRRETEKRVQLEATVHALLQNADVRAPLRLDHHENKSIEKTEK